MRRLLSALSLVFAIAVAVALYAFAEARRDPVVRRATIVLPRWPAGQPPVRVVLISDVHIGSLVSDAARLTRIVTQINALHPDLVLIAGDFIYGQRKDGAALHGPAMIAPLRGLHARLGVIGVPGNHDHATGLPVVARELAAAHVRLLRDTAVQVGPLVVGGVDDAATGHAHPIYTMAQMRILPGAPVVVTHSPEIAKDMAPDMPLLLAGHTHCGQVVLPLIGPIVEVTPPQYRCGIIGNGAGRVIVTAGLGATSAPFRLGAPPDLWLLTLGPKPGA